MTTPVPAGTPSPPTAIPFSERPYLAAVDRTNRGLGRYEMTSFFADPTAFGSFLDDLTLHFAPCMKEVDAIVGLDALGFVIAGGLSARTGKPIVLARKGSKIALGPEEKVSTGPFSDYAVRREGEKAFEIRKDLLRKGMKVLIMDEWIDSGAQMTALCRVLESEGVQVLGIGTLQLREGKSAVADALWERYNVFAANRSPVLVPPATTQ